MQRQSKINGSLFLDLIVFNSDSLKEQSLNDLSIILKDEHDIDITKQSLHDRFNNYALLFLKSALETMFQKQVNFDQALFPDFNAFNRILIKDSTCFQIDESLADYYPGSGGAGSSASVRIQFEYDLLTGKIIDLSVNPFNEQDSTNSKATIELTKEGDLIIRDLAYMGLDVLEYLINNFVYFLCRINPNTYAYEKKVSKYVKIDFAKITRYMKKHNIDMLEKEVYLGKKKLKVRLIMYLLPDNVVEKRLRKARQNNKKQGGGGNLSKEYIAKATLNLFITNADEEMIHPQSAWSIYRLRWQIELIFKIWKSICNIEKIKKVKKHRLECYIYSKLILIVLGWHVLWGTAKILFDKERRALSFQKASKTLFRRKVGQLRQIFFLNSISIESFMSRFYELSRKKHILEKRKSEPTSLELLLNSLVARFNREYSLA